MSLLLLLYKESSSKALAYSQGMLVGREPLSLTLYDDAHGVGPAAA